ncbi:MAG: type II toxin-antitoxin system prevent-host-death family antitoxin [Pseudohongiella sp.]|nr:type II toxin-antitoxin system prevent-host-death family antitoxin [Pseudohongiella sp.]
MMTINISELRANLLKYLDKANHGEQITVTTNGKVIATICAPFDQKAVAKAQLAELAVSAKIHDVVSPVETQWDALL